MLSSDKKADAIVAALKAAEENVFAKMAKRKNPATKLRKMKKNSLQKLQRIQNLAKEGSQKGIRGKAADIAKKQGISKETIDAAIANRGTQSGVGK